MRKLTIIGLILLAVGCGNKEKEGYTVPRLVEKLKDKDPNVRYSAARDLGKYGAEAKPAVPALVEALKDESPMVRMGAAYALGEVGPDAKDAVPELKKATNDRDAEVRKAAAYAMKQLEAPPKK
jgi:HEAT repeat protein